MFFVGFDIFILIWSESCNGFPSKSLVFTIIVFTPLENGEMSISNLVFSVNSIVLKLYTTSCASTLWISPAGNVPLVSNATTPSRITPNTTSTLSVLFIFLWTEIFSDLKLFSAFFCTLNWKNPPNPIIKDAIMILRIINWP